MEIDKERIDLLFKITELLKETNFEINTITLFDSYDKTNRIGFDIVAKELGAKDEIHRI